MLSINRVNGIKLLIEGNKTSRKKPLTENHQKQAFSQQTVTIFYSIVIVAIELIS